MHGFKISLKTKYFISDYQGKNDPRWLPSVDGKENILPSCPNTEFRYLGAYISLALTSKKQIQILGDTVMNWRWRALTQKIDSAQLASTITELLLPKMEIGLLYAYGITSEMCKGWTSTIIATLSQIAGIGKPKSNLTSLNAEAFCLLANFPEINLRMQTIRITEGFTLLNSANCDSGKTTRARLCALRHKSTNQMGNVLQDLFGVNTTINHRPGNRLGDICKMDEVARDLSKGKTKRQVGH